jgi:hypothetical protein
MVATEWGIQGFLLFLGFLWANMRLLRHVRLRAQSPDWFYYRALGVELAMVGQIIAGVFTDRLYGESVYWMCALGFALYRMQQAELPEPTRVPSPTHEMTALERVPHTAPLEGLRREVSQ